MMAKFFSNCILYSETRAIALQLFLHLTKSKALSKKQLTFHLITFHSLRSSLKKLIIMELLAIHLFSNTF